MAPMLAVPEMTPVLALIESPAGSAGATVQVSAVPPELEGERLQAVLIVQVSGE